MTDWVLPCWGWKRYWDCIKTNSFSFGSKRSITVFSGCGRRSGSSDTDNCFPICLFWVLLNTSIKLCRMMLISMYLLYHWILIK
jgi:hypothetical protein